MPWWTADKMPLLSEWRVRIGYSEVYEANQKNDGSGALQLSSDGCWLTQGSPRGISMDF